MWGFVVSVTHLSTCSTCSLRENICKMLALQVHVPHAHSVRTYTSTYAKGKCSLRENIHTYILRMLVSDIRCLICEDILEVNKSELKVMGNVGKRCKENVGKRCKENVGKSEMKVL